jgi:hypothetical protein
MFPAVGCYELKCKLWLTKVAQNYYTYQEKEAKLLWLQDPSQINVDNLNNGVREASRHFKNKKPEISAR